MTSKPNVLIIDDREFDRVLYKEYLGDEQYEFSELDDGESAIAQLNTKEYDLILLDWQMPRVGGLETLRNVKNSAHRETPIIIITGLEDEKVLEQAFDYGGVDFINKPVSKIELNSRVNSVLKLYHSTKMLIKQKEELQSLNTIISSQKEELQEAFKIKQELAAIKEEQQQVEIDDKNRKIMTMEVDTSKSVNQVKNINSLISEGKKILSQDANGHLGISILNKLQKEVEDLFGKEDSWSDFKEIYESIEPEFFKKLTTINPKLTSLDLQHCAYIKMNLDNYEITKILNVELKSLQQTRYRLKKKLKVEENSKLREFIVAI